MKSEKIFDFTFFIQIKSERRLSARIKDQAMRLDNGRFAAFIIFCSMKAQTKKNKKRKSEDPKS